MYFDGPPPRSKYKSSPGRNYVPVYRANGTGRDLMSFYPRMKVMPHTAKVYHAVKAVPSKRGSRLPHTTILVHLVLVGIRLYGKKKKDSNGGAITFRPTQTPWASNSNNPWANDREVTPARLLVNKNG